MNLRHLIQKGLVSAILRGSAGSLLALGYGSSSCAPQEEKPAPIYYHSSSGDLVLPNGTVCQGCTFTTEGEESQCEIEAIEPSTPPVKFQLLQEKSRTGEQKKGELTRADWTLYPLLPQEPKKMPLPFQAEVQVRCSNWWGGFPASTSKLRPTISRLEDIVVTPEPEIAMVEPPAAPPSPPPAIKPKPKKEPSAVTVPLPPPQTNNPPDCGIAYPQDKEGIIDLSNGQSGNDIGSRPVDKFLSHYTVIIDEKDKVTLRFPPLRCLDRERDELELSFKVKKVYGKKFVFGYGPVEQGKQEIFNWGRESFFLDAGAHGNVSPLGETYDVFLFLGEDFKRPLADGSLGRNTEPVRVSFAVKPVNDRPYVRNPLPAKNGEMLHLPNVPSRHLRLRGKDYFRDDDNSVLSVYAQYVCRRNGKEEELSDVFHGQGAVLVPGKPFHCGADLWGGQTLLKLWGNDGEFSTEAVHREVSLYGADKIKGQNLTIETLVVGDSVEGRAYYQQPPTGFMDYKSMGAVAHFLDNHADAIPPSVQTFTLYYLTAAAKPYLRLQTVIINSQESVEGRQYSGNDLTNSLKPILDRIPEVLPFTTTTGLQNQVGIEIKVTRKERNKDDQVTRKE